jgi:rSAM/selenodomain-associated transferase 2
MLSIIVPTLNEGESIVSALAALASFRARKVEVIVADGGSEDQTITLAQPLCDRVVSAPRGRGGQMNAGAGAARGDVFLFLHADTRLPDNADLEILSHASGSDRTWGRFDVRIAGRHPLLPLVAATMNLRSRFTGIATGDQAMFVTRDAFHAVGGFPDIALMEDIALSRALKRRGPPLALHNRVTTSGRRWDERGLVTTVVLMWRLRLAFYLGTPPHRLAKAYGYAPRDR